MPFPKRLKQCKNPNCKLPDRKFLPDRQLQDCCSVPCTIEWIRIKAKTKQEKGYAADKRKFNLNNLSHQKNSTQQSFNAFIRALEQGQICISCLQPKPLTCGHFKTVAACPELRYDPRNAYGQCSQCNGGQVNYRPHDGTVIKRYSINLAERMGSEMVAYLNSHHEPKHYTCQDLIELRKMFNAETRYIEKHGRPSKDWRTLPQSTRLGDNALETASMATSLASV